MFTLIAAAAIFVLSLKMEAYELQAQKTQIENEIATKEGEISELNTEVTNLASYDRICRKGHRTWTGSGQWKCGVAEKYGKN